MECFESDIQPQPSLKHGGDVNYIEWWGDCKIRVLKGKGIEVLLNTEEKKDKLVFFFPKEKMVEVKISWDGAKQSWEDSWLKRLSITIFYRDPRGIVDQFMTKFSSQHIYGVKTLRKGFEEGLGIKVKEEKEEQKDQELADQMPF